MKTGKVYWKLGVDSHDGICELFLKQDKDLSDDMEPPKQTFARVEVIPINGKYLQPNGWSIKIDEKITPYWWRSSHEKLAYAAQEEWLKQLYSEINMKEALAPINPLQVKPPKCITDVHLSLLKKWAQVWDQVGAQVWTQVGTQVGTQVRDQVRDQVWDQVWTQVGTQVGDQVRDQVWTQVWTQVYCYFGSLFPKIVWKKPFNIMIDTLTSLWKLGLIPLCYDDKWHLHGSVKAKNLWEGTL